MTSGRAAQGGWIDRARIWRFRFDGREYGGHPGDTLASALLANGVRVMGRSFKYHRPRGVLAAGAEEPNALVTLRAGARSEPNLPATVVELWDGLAAGSQNRFPSLRFDVGALNNLLAPLIPAGFYYKTFMGPGRAWERVFEPAIRRAAGLGRAPTQPDPDRYEIVHAHCDVLVVGAGAAGLAAARAAALAGARVMLVERDFLPGGATLVEPALSAWRAAMLGDLGGTELLPRASAFGAYDGGTFGIVERVADHVPEPPPHTPRQRLHVVRARRAVLATGAVQRLMAFPGNDRPGVMLADAAVTYLHRYGVRCGERAVVLDGDGSGAEVARALASGGIEIAAVLDTAAGERVTATYAAPDLHALRARRRDGTEAYLSADLLCMAGGWSPQTQLAGMGAALCGSAAGAATWRAAALSGHEAGRLAALALGFTADVAAMVPDIAEPARAAAHGIAGPVARGKAFVDLQHDVTADDVRLAHREGYAHPEHMKRYTTHGMGTDQGRTGGALGVAVLAAARGADVPEAGLPRARPPVSPVSWGALAGAEVGAAFKPVRRTPLHAWHAAHGAAFVNTGLWARPLAYGGTDWDTVLREARAVRGALGITDVSTLGKIDVQGPDAAAFLDRIYANAIGTLKPGRARYGIMLHEDGMVFDDGTVSRLGAAHFLLSCTTANTASVVEHLEFHAAATWPELDVRIVPVTDHWAQFALAGPRAREVLAPLAGGADLSNAAFPFMAVAPMAVAGVPGRVARISFSGELAYEIAVPAGHALPVWEALLRAGAAFGIVPYGLDALNVLRVEKGHLTTAEINGTTTADDLGLGRMLKAQGDFIGRVLARRPALLAADRWRLVGIRPVREGDRLRGGMVLLPRADAREAEGHLTSVVRGAEMPGWIALALLRGGAARAGETLVAASLMHGEAVPVTVVSPHFVDPENARVRA